MQENKKKSFDYKKTLKSLLKNKSFVFLLIVFGLYGGVAVAIAVLLNQLILAYYSVRKFSVLVVEITLK